MANYSETQSFPHSAMVSVCMLRRIACTLPCLVALAACSTDASPKPGPDAGPPAEDAIVLYPSTKLLDAATLALISERSEDLAQLSFRRVTPELAGIEAGDIVLGGISDSTPHGLLRRVLEVSREGDKLLWRTEQAGLADAIERGRIRLPETRLRDIARSVRKGMGADSYDQDITLALNDIDLGNGVTAGASLAFGVGLEVDLSIDAHEVAGKVVLSGNQSATADVHAALASSFGPATIPVATIPFPPIPITIGGVPVVISTALSVSFGLEGTTSGKFDWSASEKAHMNVGVELGTEGVRAILDGDATAQMDPIKLDANLSARAHTELKLAVAVNAAIASAAFEVGAQGYVALTADLAQADTCFEASRGLDGLYGVNAKLLGVELAAVDARKNLLDEAWQSGSCSSEPLFVEPWAVVLKSSELDREPKLAVLSDQSVVVAANRASASAYVTRLAPSGEPVWTQLLGGSASVVAVSAGAAQDGSSRLFGSAEGAPIWMELSAAGAREAASIATSSEKPSPSGARFVASRDGGVLMAGQALNADDVFEQWAAKLEAAGQVVWARAYGNLGSVRALAEAHDGGLFLVGDTTVGGSPAMQVTRIDAEGSPVFAKTFGNGRLYAVSAAEGGGIATAGATATGEAATLLRIADDGTLLWGFAYADASADHAEFQARAVLERHDGFLVAGRRGFSDDSDFWLMHVDAEAGLGWSRAYGGALYDEAFALALTSDNGAVVVGESASFGGVRSTLVLRVPESGALSFSAESAATSRNVEGTKEPLSGPETTQTPTPSTLQLSTQPAAPSHWPLESLDVSFNAL